MVEASFLALQEHQKSYAIEGKRPGQGLSGQLGQVRTFGERAGDLVDLGDGGVGDTREEAPQLSPLPVPVSSGSPRPFQWG